MSTTPLTPAQHAILTYALEHTNGKIDWFPDHIKGGARTKVLQGMFNRALITPSGKDRQHWRVAAAGYEALGKPRPGRKPKKTSPDVDPELDAAVAAAEAKWANRANKDESDETTPNVRPHSKQAEVIRMLQRPEGATVQQICDVTGWRAHTVRGTFAGVFKKRLGLSVVSDKAPGGERIYRVA